MQTSTRMPRTEQERRSNGTPQPWFRWKPDDGFLTLILLALIVFITIASIQSVTPPLAPGLHVLTGTTFVGLVLGYVAVQQGRLPHGVVHCLALGLGIFYAFNATAGEVLDGDMGALWAHTVRWVRISLLRGGQSNDNAVFVLFLAILTLVLAYLSVWLVLRARRPWLAVLANIVVLLINLNFTTSDKYIYLLLFLLFALLLFVRFTLAENIRQWRMRGIRFSPDLSWDFMQAGAIFAVIVLLLAYLLPAGTGSQALQSAFNSPTSPWNALQARLAGMFSGVTGKGTGQAGAFFGSSLHLSNSVDLPTQQILHYTVTVGNDSTQYLLTQTFDSYDGVSNWSATPSTPHRVAANVAQVSSTSTFKLDTYSVTFDQVPQGGQGFLFAPGDEAALFTVPSAVSLSSSAHVPTMWQAQSALPQGARVTAQGYVSIATEDQLRQVPYPNQAQGTSGDYSRALVDEYLPSDESYIPPAVRDAAKQAVAGTSNMYDAAVALEDYLRVFTYSTHNPDPPANVDEMTWFLQQKRGFCTLFASAMALMARYEGMPARLASGFASGTFDPKTSSYIVRGTQAHTWTQIYFGKYGWINFEPTQTFAKFNRQIATPGSSTAQATPGVNPNANQNQKPNGVHDNGGNNSATAGGSASPVVEAGAGLTLLVVVLLLVAAVFLMWWRALYRGLSPVAMAFARVARLGAWAGAPPRRSQTPTEYAQRLGTVIPTQQATLDLLADRYTQERWGGIAPDESDIEVATLYDQVQRSMLPLISARLRELPGKAMRLLRRGRRG